MTKNKRLPWVACKISLFFHRKLSYTPQLLTHFVLSISSIVSQIQKEDRAILIADKALNPMGRPLLPQQRGYLAPPPLSSSPVASADELFRSRPASAAAALITRNTASRTYENTGSASRRDLRNKSSVEAPMWDSGALGVHLGAIARSPVQAEATLRPVPPLSASAVGAAATSAANVGSASVSRPGNSTANSRPGTSSDVASYNPANKMSAEAQLREDIRRRPGASSSKLMAAAATSSSSLPSSSIAAAAEGNGNAKNSSSDTNNRSTTKRLVTSPLKLKDVLAPRDTHNRVFDPMAPPSEVQARATVAAIAYSEARNNAEVSQGEV